MTLSKVLSLLFRWYVSIQSIAMDAWKRHALVSLEHELKVNLSLEGILSRLACPEGEFMTGEERRSVEDVQDKSNKVGKIIEILQGKDNKDFDIFQKILRESGNEVWAEKLNEGSTRHFNEHHSAKGECFSKCVCVYPWTSTFF